MKGWSQSKVENRWSNGKGDGYGAHTDSYLFNDGSRISNGHVPQKGNSPFCNFFFFFLSSLFSDSFRPALK